MDGVLSTPAVMSVRRWHQRLAELVSVLSAAMGAQAPRPWGHFSAAVGAHVAAAEADLFPILEALQARKAVSPGAAAGRLHEVSASLDALRTLADTLRVSARQAGPLEDQLLAMLDELEVFADAEAHLSAGALRLLVPPRARQAPRVYPGTPTHPPHLRGGLLRRAIRRVLG